MKVQRGTLWLISITLAWWLGAGWAHAAEFSATVVTRMKGQENKGKVYLAGDKMRREFTTPRGENITIARQDKKVMWMLMPEQKMYMEMQFQPSDFDKGMMMPKDQQARMKLVGQETVQGYETDKYETTVKMGQGAPVKQHIWIAKKLGVPIKVAGPDGKVIMEYLEIKEGDVPADLFEVPQGYQKMSMPPGMPPGMSKEMRQKMRRGQQ